MNTEENIVLCGLCQKEFTCPSKLIIHKRIHSGEKHLQSTLCPKAFITSSSLIVHK